jgi:cyclic beta-1,2-glucan synthetase
VIAGYLRNKWSAVRGKRPGQPSYGSEPTLRAELFSADQMEQHGEFLAGLHKDTNARGADRLLPRLADNERVLIQAGKLLTEAIEAERRITPAGEWLLDNFYLVQEQIRLARLHLPKRYSWELPRLTMGASTGFPRVYDIALEAISHGDGRIDTESLARFVAVYQRSTALTLGELWAIPIMLRLALIENLRRVAARLAVDQADRNLADSWADRIADTVERDAKNLILIVADMARSTPPMRSAFVAEFARRLQSYHHALALPLTWIDQSLAESGLTTAQLVQAENQQQAADQLSVGNSIGSLRLLGKMDWREFVESMSVTERILRRDPAGIYGKMDFATRDRYRHAVEEMARKGRLSEPEVAQAALGLATQAAAASIDERAAHVGYYLIDAGLPQLEGAAHVHFSLLRYLRGVRPRLFLYLGSIFLIAATGVAIALVKAHLDGVHGWAIASIALLAALCASQLAVTAVNRLSGMLTVPRALPCMDFSDGIATSARTLVVVPAMLSSKGAVDALIEALEIRFLANRDECTHFGLLTDFDDAPEETTANDEPWLQAAVRGIEALNEQYGNATGSTCFFLFHRPRRWNAQERLWMGHERKRGKLGDLNALLRGAPPGASFSQVTGDISALSAVKYVVTLDTDTRLPRDAVRRLAATMAHPLNRAHYDAVRERVVAGYGILQPRVMVSLPSAQRSRYARLHVGDGGIDPYTRAVSDAYQDLFGEGSFIGKGIYDVDAFELALKGRLPENRILSHDLLEGCYARSGLASDIELYEDYPSSYRSDARRRHRWVRGDWQIAHWLLPRVSGTDARGNKNPLSALSRWKVLDNLRRSLVPIASTLLLLLGWIALPTPEFWTLVVLGVTLIPALASSLFDLARKPKESLLRQHLGASLRVMGESFVSMAFALVCLPYEMYFNLDAILRTGVRVLITHRNLLQWTPSSEADARSRTSLAGSIRAMWFSPALAIATGLYLSYARPMALVVAAPVLLLWCAAPLIEWWLGRPIETRVAALTADETDFLRKLARRTWAYFDDLITEDDHWLPPDNMQEQPATIVAHRTSPTNIGLALLSHLSAYDFGYLGMAALVERCGRTLDTMQGLERERGHFYNWYDTQSLRPLTPIYVSTVDSGNLCAHLFTLHAGLRELPDRRIVDAQIFGGLRDTLAILIDTAPTEAAQGDAIARFQKRLDSVLRHPPSTLLTTYHALAEFHTHAVAIVDSVATAADGGAHAWACALRDQCLDAANELKYLLPWLEILPVPAALDDFLQDAAVPTLRDLPQFASRLLRAADDRVDVTTADRAWLDAFRRHLAETGRRAVARMAAIERRARQAYQFAQMDFGFLYDKDRRLFTVGYNLADHRPDASYYDLLASEARLANFVAIALGQVPQESWFALGRLLTHSGGEPVLLSWGGSMFEYLMPLLVMPSYADTLLDRTCTVAVKRQIDYARQCRVPWGISESSYNAVDAGGIYQYRSFGVPGLGLRRGLAADLVITPHATMLALMVTPREATQNLLALKALGLLGRFGFFEAMDYTPARLRRGEAFAIVRSFMAHHQGMSLLALADAALGRPMRRRFAAEPLFAATLQLLQEKVPRHAAAYVQSTELTGDRTVGDVEEMPVRVYTTADTPWPGVQLLSNGRYHVMLTNAGGGYSRCGELSLTRWREDGTCDNWGSFCYIRDVDSGNVWSNTLQPTLVPGNGYEAIFTEPHVEFLRHDDNIETHTDIAVSPEDDIELRRVRLTNRSHALRTLEVTSYAEVVLERGGADDMQRAFSNLFVETEILHPRPAVLCMRRPRSNAERWPWLLHLMTLHGADSVATSFETDRLRFVGRDNGSANPLALREAGALSGSQGAVLDPIVAIRHRFVLEPEQSVTLDIVTGVGENRAACLGLVEKYQDRHLGDRVFDLAWTHSQVTLRQINVTDAEAQVYGRLAGRLLYANASLRADPKLIASNRRGQSGLWGYAISGDLPIVLLQVKDQANIELVHQLVKAHAYWRLKGLAVDLVIWNDDHGGYRQAFQDQILGFIAAGAEGGLIDRPGGIFVRPAEQIASEDRILLQAVARVIISDARGTLAEQVKRRDPLELAIPRFRAKPIKHTDEHAVVKPSAELLKRDLMFDNGLGGFSTDGSEYIITTSRNSTTPAPWANVLANPDFGSVVTQSGSAYTWAENAHEYRLSPWYNDPVGDPSGEAFYLRDEESGRFWSPSPWPCSGETPYLTRHGFGYSVFEHIEDGIRTELWTYVALDAPVKFSVVKVQNLSGRSRRLSLTGYVEWVLGDLRTKSAMHIVTEIDANGGALLARNAFNFEFADRVAFFDVDDALRMISGDRSEFIGRNGTLQMPATMSRTRLSGKVGAAMEPCAAIQIPVELAAGQSREVIFRLGSGRGVEKTSELISRLRTPGTARTALDAVRAYWKRTLGVVQVRTPQPGLDVLTNGWLLYQTIACRLWGRSGYYQSGGAFGFRDQLQDAMALVHAAPVLLREHLLRCASRQFRAGDVQHWWHPPTGRGVRTRCSDDYLWLPLAVWRYVSSTGDTGVLAERCPFLDGRSLSAGEESNYDLPTSLNEAADLYEHCLRAIRHGLNFGTHGLPLMGSGDWNDGMNNVGIQGKGESVWLAFFLYHVLTRFAEIAHLRGDGEFAANCSSEAATLRGQIELHGWDGDWYRRAYFDDGTPLGSSTNPECCIDSIAQSWSVLSGAGDPTRARTAMNSLDRLLVDRKHALVKLLEPSFDKSDLDPGYIKGYVPGVRENGGQYTHAAIWASMAFAALGDADRACELLGMIDPIGHSNSPQAAAVFKVESYVVTGDVYAVEPHVGRGGWSWYTGSAGWMYRSIVESILGLRLEGDRLRIVPCIPRSWDGFEVTYRYLDTPYEIVVVQNTAATASMRFSLDGEEQREPVIPLRNDGQMHRVDIAMTSSTAV